MAPPRDPRIQQALDLLVTTLNDIARVTSSDQRLAQGLLDIGAAGFDIEQVEVPTARQYSESDAIQLVNELTRKVGLRQGLDLSVPSAERNEVFFRIISTLPDQLLPGVARPPTRDGSALQNLSDSVVFTAAHDIRRFPQHATQGMREGAVWAALLDQNRVSQEMFNARFGGRAAPDVQRQVFDADITIQSNLSDILNAAGAEAKGDEFLRAVTKVVSAESKDGVVVAPNASLFPVVPGFGAPEPKRFTEQETKDLTTGFKKSLQDALPTANQLETPEEKAALKRYIDDIEDRAQDSDLNMRAQGASEDAMLLARQSILNQARPAFEQVLQATVFQAGIAEQQEQTEAAVEGFVARFNTPSKIKNEISNLLPEKSQLRTDAEKKILDEFIANQVDAVQIAELTALRQGMSPVEVAQAQFDAIQTAIDAWEPFRQQAIGETRAESVPETVKAKNDILSKVFQTPQFQSVFPGVEFEDLDPEVQAQARSEISGLDADTASLFALHNAARWKQASDAAVAEAAEAKAAEEFGTKKFRENQLAEFFSDFGLDPKSISDERTRQLETMFSTPVSQEDQALIADDLIPAYQTEKENLDLAANTTQLEQAAETALGITARTPTQVRKSLEPSVVELASFLGSDLEKDPQGADAQSILGEILSTQGATPFGLAPRPQVVPTLRPEDPTEPLLPPFAPGAEAILGRGDPTVAAGLAAAYRPAAEVETERLDPRRPPTLSGLPGFSRGRVEKSLALAPTSELMPLLERALFDRPELAEFVSQGGRAQSLQRQVRDIRRDRRNEQVRGAWQSLKPLPFDQRVDALMGSMGIDPFDQRVDALMASMGIDRKAAKNRVERLAAKNRLERLAAIHGQEPRGSIERQRQTDPVAHWQALPSPQAMPLQEAFTQAFSSLTREFEATPGFEVETRRREHEAETERRRVLRKSAAQRRTVIRR